MEIYYGFDLSHFWGESPYTPLKLFPRSAAELTNRESRRNLLPSHTEDYGPFLKSQLASMQSAFGPHVVQIWSRPSLLFISFVGGDVV